MAEITIHINGRPYEIACDDGQEGRIVDLAAFVDHRLQEIARVGGAYNDPHLLVLTALVIADELFAARSEDVPTATETAAASPNGDQEMIAGVLSQLVQRIDGIADKVESV